MSTGKPFKRSRQEALTKALEEAKKILESSVQINRNLFVAVKLQTERNG